MRASTSADADRYQRYRALVKDEPLPLALVDLDAFERNVDRLLAPVRAANKTLRVASKSLRCLDLMKRVFARGADVVRGVMGFTVSEAEALVDAGRRELADRAIENARREGRMTVLDRDIPEDG